VSSASLHTGRPANGGCRARGVGEVAGRKAASGSSSRMYGVPEFSLRCSKPSAAPMRQDARVLCTGANHAGMFVNRL